MDAVVCHDFGDARVEDVPRPEPGDGEVLVRVSRVQLSVTECQIYRGMYESGYEDVRSRITDGDGRLFGHEFSGVVTALGSGVDAFEEGDRVYAPGKSPCGECVYCRADEETYCRHPRTVGMHRPGALAEYVAAPAETLCTVPDGVSDAEAAALQPLAAALVCVRDAGLDSGDTVGVVGTGVMGYQLGQLALDHGASRVFAVDVDPTKVELAAEQGLVGIDAEETDPVERVHRATDGIGVDVAFEAVGGSQSHLTTGSGPVTQAFEMVRPGGTFVPVGHFTDEMTIDPAAVRKKYLTWIAPRDKAGVVSLTPNIDTGAFATELVASGRVSIADYISHELGGLGDFERAVSMTLDKASAGALGPPQLVLD
ncbi:zinc-binding dehydrogenase [Haloplanus litoreus]|uniref:Zinc-binding dehydrogenase n=1 Tax=Haloplanus litoreus TaxID=767515 RepID=A0ABD6A270_9EURY